MRNVTLSHGAEIQRRTLDEEDRREVDKWCDLLKIWRKNDKISGRRPTRLELGRGAPGPRKVVYQLKTDGDIVLFFEEAGEKDIKVNDIFYRRATWPGHRHRGTPAHEAL